MTGKARGKEEDIVPMQSLRNDGKYHEGLYEKHEEIATDSSRDNELDIGIPSSIPCP